MRAEVEGTESHIEATSFRGNGGILVVVVVVVVGGVGVVAVVVVVAFLGGRVVRAVDGQV